MSPGGTDKFSKGSHYCKTPVFRKKAGQFWSCSKCGRRFRCKEVRGRLTWLQVSDGRK